MEIRESLVLNSIAIKLEPNHPQIVQLSSTAKFSVTSQLGGEEEKEEKNSKTKGGARGPQSKPTEGKPKRTRPQGGRKQEPSRW